MKRTKRSRQSKVDLLEIWLYVAEHSPKAADKLIDTLEARIQLLAEWPGIGARRDDLAPGLRGLPVGNYIIFYRPTRQSIELVRVLHGSRDLPKLFS